MKSLVVAILIVLAAAGGAWAQNAKQLFTITPERGVFQRLTVHAT